jgi:hypothetical protein
MFSSRASVLLRGTGRWLLTERVVPLALFFCTLLLYLATLTQVHTFDALSYVTSVERKPWTEVFHPHHLAYGPLGALALALGRALGYGGGAALPMQLANATAGALGVTLFFSIVRRATGRGDVALVAALLLCSAYAYWYYAVEIEVYTVATLFLLICLDLLLRLLQHPSRRGMALMGLAQGGAILFHQTNLLFSAPLFVALLVSAYDVRRRHKSWTYRHAATTVRLWAITRFAPAYVIVLVLTVGLPYLFVGVVVSGFRSWDAFDAWLTEYARTGWWGGPITAQKWQGLGIGLADTLAQPGGAVLWLLLAGLVVVHLRRLGGRPHALVAGLLAWLLVYGAFFLWWEPDNIEFWIASLPPALLLLAVALRGERRWGPGVWLALAVASAALGLNADAITRRGDPATDLQRVIAHELAAHSQPADLLLVPDGLIELYLPYYEHHDTFLSLNQALFDANDDWQQACATVRTRIDASLHAGATTLLSDDVLHPPILLLQRHQLKQSEIDACFAPYRDTLLPIALGPNIPRYWRLPTSQELAEGPGWHFDRFSEGWSAQNIEASRFSTGWQFVPDVDPALISPIMQLNASRYRAIEVRMTNQTLSNDAQLFFAGPDGALSEAHSVSWMVRSSAAALVYRVELAGLPGWQGTITWLRLDPVGVGDGREVRIEWIRLVPR